MKKRFRTVMIGLGILAALIFAAACESPVTPEPTPKPAPIPDINSVAFGAGRYVAVGDGGAIFSSSDGLTWSRKDSKTTGTLWSVIYENNLFVAVGDGNIIWTSPNGEEWTVRRYVGEVAILYSAVYADRQFVIVGVKVITDTNGKITGTRGVIVTSANGITWNEERSLPRTVPLLRSIAYAGGKFVAVGRNETIVTSTDGITWSRTHSASSSSTANHLLKVIPAAGGFVAVGANGVVLTSSNGTTWRRSLEGPTNTDGSKNDLYSAAYKPGGNYVVTGNRGTVIYSSNGTSWTSVSGIVPYLNDVIYAGGKFVAVGSRLRILISSDGVTWNYRNVGERGTGALRAVIHGGGKFVAVGDKGSIFTSTDGVGWTKRTLN